MLAEVRFLGVTLATILADVSLEMLALLVLGDVLKQRRFVAEAFVARITLVGFVRLMTPGVRLEVAELAEGFLAAWVSTSERN